MLSLSMLNAKEGKKNIENNFQAMKTKILKRWFPK